MAALVQFPDAVAVVRSYLKATLPKRGETAPVFSQVPAQRPARFTRLERVGGTRVDRVTDRPRLAFECWGSGEADATDLAILVRALVFALPGWHGAIAYDVLDVGGPNTAPDPASGQYRTLFAVEVSLRGRALTSP